MAATKSAIGLLSESLPLFLWPHGSRRAKTRSSPWGSQQARPHP